MDDIDRRRHILELCKTINDPTERLNTYFNYYSDLPAQGTLEWKAGRKIGASSAASILNQNKFSSMEDCALSLLNLKPREPPQITMEWGHLFEPAAKIYLSNVISIREFGSIPGFGNADTRKIYTSCSPDGLFIMTEEFADMNDPIENKYIGEIGLLEIKCPYRRNIGDEIPIYYYPQLYLGMRTIDICEFASFCEFGFRICSLYDLNFRRSCRCDTTQRSIPNDTPPYAVGIIIVCGDKPIACNEATAIKYDILDGYEQCEGDLLDQFDNLYRFLKKADPTLLDIECYLLFIKQFGGDMHKKICQYLHKIFIRWSGIDFGSVNNFLYKWTELINESIVSLTTNNYQLHYLPCLSEIMNDSECTAFFDEQISEFKADNIIGVIPYKIIDFQARIVNKIPYTREIRNLVRFGMDIELIAQNDTIEQQKLVKNYCATYKEKYYK